MLLDTPPGACQDADFQKFTNNVPQFWQERPRQTKSQAIPKIPWPQFPSGCWHSAKLFFSQEKITTTKVFLANNTQAVKGFSGPKWNCWNTFQKQREGKKAQRTVLPGNELVLLTSSHVKARCHSSWSNNLRRTNRKNPSQEQALEHSRTAGIKASSSGEETQNKELGAKKDKEATPLWKYNVVQKLTHSKIFLPSP